MKNRKTIFTTILLALGVLALSPMVQAVVPPPDGGYPNFNTAEGQHALFSLDVTAGEWNTAVGGFALSSNVDGSFNTGVGTAALLFNTGEQNTAVGVAALLSNSTGSENTAIGATALSNNTATGNTAVGSKALTNNTTGGTLGTPILDFNVGPNVAVGSQALQSNAITSANTAVGYQALASFTTGVQGTDAGLNTAVGFQVLANATTGAVNSGFGYQALFHNTEGTENVAIGGRALFSNTTGTHNIAIGDVALDENVSGSNNIAIGVLAGDGITTADNVICIGAFGDDVNDSCYIGKIFGQSSPSGTAVFVNADGKLGTTVSSRRFKKEIKPMDRASEAILALKPVTFRYKSDPAATGSQFGLIAEEVCRVNPDLVVRDKNDEIVSVRYDQVNAMLLNEFLKEHKKGEEQQASIMQLESKMATQEAISAQQQKRIEFLRAQLKEQAAQIQKVSAQLELTKPASQMALSSP